MFMFSAFSEFWAMVGQEATVTTVAIEVTGINNVLADNKKNPKNQEKEKLVKHENPKDHEQGTLTLNGHVNLKVQAQDGDEIFFRMRANGTFRKMMNRYCDRKCVKRRSIRFLFDGRHLLPEQTPFERDMEDGDTIDAMFHFAGGGSCH